MKAQHTPGKWNTEYDANTQRWEIHPEGLNLIGTFCHVHKPHNIGISECEANAHLIAAAPELLEACKYAEGLIRVARQYFPKSMNNSDKFNLENTCAAIGNAIAKAEGRS